MQERSIALDVGTTAVRAVEVVFTADGTEHSRLAAWRTRPSGQTARPVLRRYGSVDLPPGAVVEGEIVDPIAVGDAIRRLWASAGFTGRTVRVAVASTRVILRPVELPRLSAEDTRSALRLQLGDLVPFSPDETVFDAVAVAEATSGGEAGQEGNAGDARDAGDADEPDHAKVLLAGAHLGVVEPLLGALKVAGLKVTGVDAAPLALARWAGAAAPRADEEPRPAPHPPVDEGDEDREAAERAGAGPSPAVAVVDVGASLVELVVVRGGTPVFARTLTGIAGESVTTRLADALGIDRDEAERLKLRLPLPLGADGLRAETALDGAVDELAAELRDSLAFYAGQTDAVPVERLLLTGGGALLAGLPDRLARRLDLDVGRGDPLAGVDLARSSPIDTSLPALAPQLTLAAALAIAEGRRGGGLVDLRPDHARPRPRPRGPLVAAAAAAAVLLVGGLWYRQRESGIDGHRAVVAAVEAEIARRSELPTAVDAIATTPAHRAVQLRAALGADIDWFAVLGELDAIGGAHGVGVTGVQGAAAVAAPSSPSAGGEAPGGVTVAAPAAAVTPATLTVTAKAPSVHHVAAWIDAVAASPRVADVWVSSATRVSGDGEVQLNASITLSAANGLTRAIPQEGAPG